MAVCVYLVAHPVNKFRTTEGKYTVEEGRDAIYDVSDWITLIRPVDDPSCGYANGCFIPK